MSIYTQDSYLKTINAGAIYYYAKRLFCGMMGGGGESARRAYKLAFSRATGCFSTS
jgi:hypothetical protein